MVTGDTDDYYTHYNTHNIAKSNAQGGAQQIVISQWPLVVTQHTANPNTALQPTYNVEATPANDPGSESLQSRVDNNTHIQSTSSSNFLPHAFKRPTLYKMYIHLIAHIKKISLPHLILLVTLKLHVKIFPK